MKSKLFALLIAIVLMPFGLMAEAAEEIVTPKGSLKVAVERLISIAGNATLDKDQKKSLIIDVVNEKMDMQVLSQRVVSRHWKKSSNEDQREFIGLFTQVVVNTYFSLLNEYTNEKVEYLKEEIKKKKYAKISTNIVMIDKKIPVTYKLVLRKGKWRIYDFSAEGVSMISTYTNDYKSTLKRGGLAGLIKILNVKLAKQ